MARTKPSQPTVDLTVAGIDIGSEEIYVAVFDQPVVHFGTFTSELLRAAAYLKEHRVTSVAIEATGVLWLPLYEILEDAGIEPYLVNGAHARNMQRPKSDVADCQWLLDLHSKRMLRRCFVPEQDFRQMRAYLRLRRDHIEMGASHIAHMKKALELMNLKLHNVIEQVHGPSGMRVLKAIVEGERDPHRLLALCSSRITNAKSEKVLASLEGNYRSEHIFALRHAIEMWEHYQQMIRECDDAVAEILCRLTEDLEPIEPRSQAKQSRHHPMVIPDLHMRVVTLCGGSDAQQVTGLSTVTVVKLIGETGTDMSPWKTEKHFTSWAGLAPNTRSSGGRRWRGKRRAHTSVGQIFREAAMAVTNSKTALGAFYRRKKAQRGAERAIVATARKIAEAFYRMMRYGSDYVELGMAAYEAAYQERRVKGLARAAEALGMRLIPAETL